MVHRLPFETRRSPQQTLIACNARPIPSNPAIDSNLFTSTCLGIAQRRRMRQQAIPPSLDQEIDIRFADNRFGIKALRLKLTYFRNCGASLVLRRLDLRAGPTLSARFGSPLAAKPEWAGAPFLEYRILPISNEGKALHRWGTLPAAGSVIRLIWPGKCGRLVHKDSLRRSSNCSAAWIRIWWGPSHESPLPTNRRSHKPAKAESRMYFARPVGYHHSLALRGKRWANRSLTIVPDLQSWRADGSGK